METCLVCAGPRSGAPARTSNVLTRAEFDTAVRNALRHYSRADLLVGNPLFHMRIATGRGAEAASVASIQKMLNEAANQIFASTRDQKLLRVLELTYFAPAPKQEAAAERLGLPFSTYRRHLTSGIERITEWLWHREEEAQGMEPARVEATEPQLGYTKPTKRHCGHAYPSLCCHFSTCRRIRVLIIWWTELSTA
jgi:hypothetical protein